MKKEEGCLLFVADLFGRKDPSSCGRANFNVEEVRICLFSAALHSKSSAYMNAV